VPMDRKRLITLDDFHSPEGILLPKRSYVWLWSILPDGTMKVENKDHFFIIPAQMATATPVPPAPIGELKKKDPCFGGKMAIFELIHKDDDLLFAIYRCREHGAWFMEDVRTGLGWYSRFIYLDGPPGDSPKEYRRIWRHYNQRSNDELNLEGLIGPMPG